MTFPANIDLSSLDGSNGFRLDGQPGDSSGISVSGAGDVNGDGFADLIVAAPQTRSGSGPVNPGLSYVVFGKGSGFAASLDLSSLDGSTGFRLVGAASSAVNPQSVSSVGDVNHDGFADVIVGSSQINESFVVFGRVSGFAPSLDLFTLNGSNGFSLASVAADDDSGWSVSAAGDINGDGFADLIIGARAGSPNGINFSGTSYVVFGKASGFAAQLDLSKLDGSTGFRLAGVAAGDGSGWSVSGAGDVNHDSFADLIIGAPNANTNGDQAGASYVVFGKASGFAASLDLSTLDGKTGFRLAGVASGDQSGFSVSGAGDVNGDGVADLIVSAVFAAPNGGESGASYVVFGKASGFDANLNLSSLNGITGFKLSGEDQDQSGNSVASAGDVNGDGFDDLIIGAPHASANGDESGASYVVFGKASGFDANLNLSSLNGSNGFRVVGAAAGNKAGFSVAAAGDVNHDGFADVIVGAYRADPNGADSGASYVVFGRAPTEAVTRIGTDADNRISGGAGDDTLIGGAGNDWINGGKGTDTAVFSGASRGYAVVSDGTTVTVQQRTGADGLDTLVNIEKLQFTDRTLDISDFNRATSLSSSQLADLTSLYIALFDRAPDALGLYYWAARLQEGTSLNQIANSFFVQPEATAAYPATTSNNAFVTAAYSHVLGRAPDAGGLSFWAGELQNGHVTRGDFMLDLIFDVRGNPAAGADAQYLANKLAAGTYFAITRGLSDTTAAANTMHLVTGDATSVSQAKAVADTAYDTGQLTVSLVGQAAAMADEHAF